MVDIGDMGPVKVARGALVPIKGRFRHFNSSECSCEPDYNPETDEYTHYTVNTVEALNHRRAIRRAIRRHKAVGNRLLGRVKGFSAFYRPARKRVVVRVDGREAAAFTLIEARKLRDNLEYSFPNAVGHVFVCLDGQFVSEFSLDEARSLYHALCGAIRAAELGAEYDRAAASDTPLPRSSDAPLPRDTPHPRSSDSPLPLTPSPKEEGGFSSPGAPAAPMEELIIEGDQARHIDSVDCFCRPDYDGLTGQFTHYGPWKRKIRELRRIGIKVAGLLGPAS